jgi:hypothetical protein
MAETARECNRIFTRRRCAVLFRLFKKQRVLLAARLKSAGFQRFRTTGTHVALRDEKLNLLADQNDGFAAIA